MLFKSRVCVPLATNQPTHNWILCWFICPGSAMSFHDNKEKFGLITFRATAVLPNPIQVENSVWSPQPQTPKTFTQLLPTNTDDDDFAVSFSNYLHNMVPLQYILSLSYPIHASFCYFKCFQCRLSGVANSFIVRDMLSNDALLGAFYSLAIRVIYSWWSQYRSEVMRCGGVGGGWLHAS